ncbi:MAG: hypothetical protein AAFO94_18075, partial [Bacteroidota bacterium]
MAPVKSFLPILLLVLGCISIHAQETTEEQSGRQEPQNFNLQENLNNANNLVGGVGTVGFDNRYEGLKGHPYMYNEWYPGMLMIDGQLMEDKTASYKLDIEGRQLIAKFRRNKYRNYPLQSFEEIHLQTEGKVVSFVVVDLTPGEDKKLNVKLMEVLSPGTHRLLKEHSKFYRPADYKGGYSTDKRYADFRIDQHYFIQLPSGALKKIKLKKKALTKVFPEWKQQIEAFAKQFK